MENIIAKVGSVLERLISYSFTRKTDKVFKGYKNGLSQNALQAEKDSNCSDEEEYIQGKLWNQYILKLLYIVYILRIF